MKSLGETLRRGRALMQLTLRQVEEATGISNAYLSQLENDKIKNPSANVLYKLSTLYKIPLDNILFASGIIKDKPKSGKTFLDTALSGSGEITSEEEQKLLDYLKYLRFSNKKR